MAELKQQNIGFIALAGFLWLIPTYLVRSFPGKIVNIHPALLPKYGGKGMYGKYVHQAVKDAQEKESGQESLFGGGADSSLPEPELRRSRPSYYLFCKLATRYLARTLGDSVAALGIAHANSPTGSHLTISLGVGSTEGAATGSAEALVQTADAQLYLAKSSGRNRACGAALAGA